MQTLTQTLTLSCPKCKSPMNGRNNTQQSRKCYTCGYTIRGTIEIHKFIQANGKDIAKYYYVQGHTLLETLEHFQISSTSFYKIPEIIRMKGHHKRVSTRWITEVIRSGNGDSPLPEFNENWSDAVKLKWLEILTRNWNVVLLIES